MSTVYVCTAVNMSASQDLRLLLVQSDLAHCAFDMCELQ
jgi:hypothetical protein